MLDEKIGELWSTNQKSYRRLCWPTLNRQCAFCVCWCIWVRATWFCYMGNFNPL